MAFNKTHTTIGSYQDAFNSHLKPYENAELQFVVSEFDLLFVDDSRGLE